MPNRVPPGTIGENISLMGNNARDIRSNFEDSENGPDDRGNIRGTNRAVSLNDEHNCTNTEALNTVNNNIRNEQLQTNNDINNEVISDISRNNNNQNNDDNSEHQNRDVSRTNNQTRKLNCKNCSRQTIVLIALFVLFCLNLMAIFLVKFVPLNTDGEWTTWGRWSPCTTSCQGGMQFRSRSCINPPPSGKGRLCDGDAMAITICNNSCPYKFAAFSAGDPIAIKDGKLTFKKLIYQHGEDFDQDTGIFTCSIPGTYTFSVYLVKPQQNTTLICHLYKNRSQMINLVLGPNGQGYSSVSSTVATYLNMGDNVYLGDCSEPKDTIHWYSIFTGVLESHLN